MAAQGAQGRQQLVIVLRIADGQAQVLPPAQLSGQILHQDAAADQQLPGNGPGGQAAQQLHHQIVGLRRDHPQVGEFLQLRPEAGPLGPDAVQGLGIVLFILLLICI